MRVLAVDLGATSVRVCSVQFAAGDLTTEPTVEVLHRAAHQPIRMDDGSLRWNWPHLVAEVERGLAAGIAAGPVASIGVDAWGVDYGLLDVSGRLLSWPHSYRSDRTAVWRDTAERIGDERLYAITGIQQMPINTIYQLAVHDRSELDRADRLLMLPELMVHELTAAAHGEVTSGGTTGLLDAATRDWSPELLAAIDIDRSLLPTFTPVGTVVGDWHGVPVRLTAGHDTASAVAGLPGTAGGPRAFVCTGSWLLVGNRRGIADRSTAARAGNFSNEPDPVGGVRFLKNVNGFVILERLREAWSAGSVAELVAAADLATLRDPLDVSDQQLIDGDVDAAVRRGARLGSDATQASVVGAVLDGMASAVVAVIRELEQIGGTAMETVSVVGGGVNARPFVELLERRLPTPVQRGSAEATSIGNARLQLTGMFDNGKVNTADHYSGAL